MRRWEEMGLDSLTFIVRKLSQIKRQNEPTSKFIMFNWVRSNDGEKGSAWLGAGLPPLPSQREDLISHYLHPFRS